MSEWHSPFAQPSSVINDLHTVYRTKAGHFLLECLFGYFKVKVSNVQSLGRLRICPCAEPSAFTSATTVSTVTTVTAVAAVAAVATKLTWSARV